MCRVWGVFLVCVRDVCGLHVFCVWCLIRVLLACVCGVCVYVSCMWGVCVVHRGHAVERGMAIGYTPRSGQPSLRPQLAGVGTVSISPSKALPCGRRRCGLSRPSLGFSLAQVLVGNQGGCDHWADETPHADLALVLGKSAFEKALGWSGNLNFRGRFPTFPRLIGSPALFV